MKGESRMPAVAFLGLLLSGGVLAGAHAVALNAGAGPDRTAEIIQLSQADFDAMTDEKLAGLHEDLGRHNVATGSIDPDTADAYVRINNALLSHP